MSPAQLSLRYNDKWRGSEAWTELLPEMAAVVAKVGLKQAAHDLDERPSVLSHALNERDGHRPKAEWLPYFVAMAETDRIVEILARLRGLDVQRKRELSPQEQLDKLNAALDRNPDVAATIRKAAGV